MARSFGDLMDASESRLAVESASLTTLPELLALPGERRLLGDSLGIGTDARLERDGGDCSDARAVSLARFAAAARALRTTGDASVDKDASASSARATAAGFGSSACKVKSHAAHHRIVSGDGSAVCGWWGCGEPYLWWQRHRIKVETRVPWPAANSMGL